MPWGLSLAAGSHAGAKPAGESPRAGTEEAGWWAGRVEGFGDPPLFFSCTEEPRIHPQLRSYALIYNNKQPASPVSQAIRCTPEDSSESISPFHD